MFLLKVIILIATVSASSRSLPRSSSLSRSVIIDQENSPSLSRFLTSPRDSHTPRQDYVIAKNAYDSALKTKPAALPLHSRLRSEMLHAAAEAGIQHIEPKRKFEKPPVLPAEPVKQRPKPSRRILKPVADVRVNSEKMPWWVKAAAEHPDWVRQDPNTGNQYMVPPKGYLVEAASEYLTGLLGDASLD